MKPYEPGLCGPSLILPEVMELWEKGLPPGDKTGWPSLDRHYTVVPGQVTIITGWPGAGKSEWLDALLVNLMHQGWKHAIYSPENQPLQLHAAKLLEKILGKPFGRGPTERMGKVEVSDTLLEIMASRFMFVRVPEDGALSAMRVIETAESWLTEFPNSPRSVVIDPWNELEHFRPRHITETEYISMTLQQVRTWARTHQVHVFMVAHPQKTRRDPNSGKLPVPTLDLISGSQNWWNKADAGITVYRDPSTPDAQQVEIHVQKVRFRHVGRPGLVLLDYDRVTGRYQEPIRNLYDVKGRA